MKDKESKNQISVNELVITCNKSGNLFRKIKFTHDSYISIEFQAIEFLIKYAKRMNR